LPIPYRHSRRRKVRSDGIIRHLLPEFCDTTAKYGLMCAKWMEPDELEFTMTKTDKSALASELLADLGKAANDVAKGARDPDELRAACDEMDRIREEIRKKHGVLDIGVPPIRVFRDS
jgi:hypothetical protein